MAYHKGIALSKEQLSKYETNFTFTYKGIFPIEFHITEDDRVINLTTGYEIPTRKHNGDWRQFSVKKTTVLLHRAKAEAYIPYPKRLTIQGVDISEARVMFKDYNRHNTDINNLMWCSIEESKAHLAKLKHPSRDAHLVNMKAPKLAMIKDSIFLDKLKGLEYEAISFKYGVSTKFVDETLHSFYGEMFDFNVDRALRKRFQALIKAVKAQGLYPEMLCLLGKLLKQKNRRNHLKNTDEESAQLKALRVKLSEMENNSLG